MAKHLKDDKQKPESRTENTEEPRDREIREAVERVYQSYGSDLSAFQRDVQKDLLKLSGTKAETAA